MAENQVLKDKTGNILNPHIPRYDYDIGDLFLTMNDKNPGDRFGGTWELVGKGLTLIGVDPNNEKMNKPGMTYGSKTHKLTVEELPTQKPFSLLYGFNDGSGGECKLPYNKTQASPSAGGDSGYDWYGKGKEFELYQPSFTCYIWQKTDN